MTSTQTLSKPAKTWSERLLANEEITHGHVIQFYNLVAPLAEGYPAGGKSSNLTADEAERIMEEFDTRVRRGDGGPRIPAAGAARGIDWLVKYAVKLGMPDVDYRTITGFRLVGASCQSYNGFRAQFAPTYRCFFVDGSELDYSPTAWQAGGNDGCDYRWNKYPAGWL